MAFTDTDALYHGAKKFAVAALFCVNGIAFNIIGGQLASLLDLPLFLDCYGTLLAAFLGGQVPAIVVGYLTNLIKATFDPSAIYYGLVSVLIAELAARCWQRGLLKRPAGVVGATLLLALVCGGASSVITWQLYGFGFSDGVSTALAERLFALGTRPAYLAQLSADVLVDLCDKALELALALLTVRLLPAQLVKRFDFGIWQQAPLDDRQLADVRASHPRVLSLRTKVIAVIAFIMLLVGVVTTYISYAMFRQSMIVEQTSYGQSVARLAADSVDGDRVHAYLTEGEGAKDFVAAEARLAQIRDRIQGVEYVYVYQIRDDGCHVVLDPDTADEKGSDPGEVIGFDNAFLPQLDSLLAGEQVEAVVSNETYGWLLTAYEPVRDSSGATAAYVGVDISMEHVMADGHTFLARITSLFLAFFIVVCAVVLWLSDYSLILPLNSIARASGSVAFGEESGRAGTLEQVRALGIHTGDEVENLYQAVLKTSEDTVRYIADVREQAATIERMQDNLIMVMADLVESRDKFTGEHVRKTAAYCRIILEQMRREGMYADRLTDEFVSDVVHSAPLHDIGKIVVSDSILNKPGRLTPEEFEQMKQHTVAGGEILERAVGAVSDPGYLDEARRLAVYHHEKWDGSGYPYGTAGEDIPLSARIMAVADVFDALVSKRSYKDGMPIDKALSIIREGAGSHFDPLVAQAFLHAEAEARAIAERHGDAGGTQLTDVHEDPGDAE